MEEKIRILVLDRGFCLVCRCVNPMEFGFWIPVHDARIIRRWGTTNGLGELCNNGPKRETVLDEMIEQETIPTRAIIRVLEVNQESWEAHLKPSAKRTRRTVAS